MYRIPISYLIIFFVATYGHAQSLDLGKIGKEKILRYNGGLSFNSVYYEGSGTRQPFTYFVSGNLNFNIGGLYNLPLSFTYSNQNFDFPSPFRFNRLSLNPSYKWISAHIGDVAMAFSPYTVSGHQFTGGGIDLSPPGKFKISTLYGRFLRATEYNEEQPEAPVAYKRMGFGLKTAYAFNALTLGLTLFKAADDENSLKNPVPATLQLAPKDNAVVSIESDITLFDKAKLRIEYALSGVTEDVRLADARQQAGLLSFLLDENISTSYFNALNASFTYSLKEGSLGLGYERIDPGYRTFGAYFFNNDLENITVNANRSLFNNTVNLSVNAGLQQDNLDNSKTSELQRIVSAVNLGYKASEKMDITASYSNFQSYTNIRDQFDYVNQVGQFDNVDTLNYRQISQNTNLGIQYLLKNTERHRHSANLNFIYQTSDNQQDGETVEDGKTNFYNASASYALGFPQAALNVALVANASYNTVGQSSENLILGPTLTVGKQFFDKKLRTNFSGSYNTTFANGEQSNSIYNLRLGGNYVLRQQHNFSLNALSLFNTTTTETRTDITLTFGYNYTLGKPRLNPSGPRPPVQAMEKGPRLRFRYRVTTFSGTLNEINDQLMNVYQSPAFARIPQAKKKDLDLLYKETTVQAKPSDYKERALFFLEELYASADFMKTYDFNLFMALQELGSDMQNSDLGLEDNVDKQAKRLRQLTQDKADAITLNKARADYKAARDKWDIHLWVARELDNYATRASVWGEAGHLAEFNGTYANTIFKKFYSGDERMYDLLSFMKIRLAEFFVAKARVTLKIDQDEE